MLGLEADVKVGHFLVLAIRASTTHILHEDECRERHILGTEHHSIV